jgi:dienelactone hydrolase
LRRHCLVIAAALAGIGCGGRSAGGDAGDAGLGPDAAAATDTGSGADAGPPARTDVSFVTADGATLRGYLTAAPGTPAGAPGVVLVHQYLMDDLQWGDLPEELAAQGWRVLAFDLRGHGTSDPYTGANYLSDPVAGPADLDAALAFLADPAGGAADPARLGVVGTSVGANLTVAAAVRSLARTYVSYSARLPPVETFAGGPATGMQSVFYVASELDAGGQAADAQAMYDATLDPRDLHVYAGIADHGIAILTNEPDARPALVAWLGATL